MNIREQFAFLVDDYGFQYGEQKFENCWEGNWTVITYSFYNENGCFTIHTLPERGEVGFFCCDRFSSDRESLCARLVDIRTIEEDVWDKHSCLWSIRNPFFWYSQRKVFAALAEVIRTHLSKHDDLFGIKLTR